MHYQFLNIGNNNILTCCTSSLVLTFIFLYARLSDCQPNKLSTPNVHRTYSNYSISQEICTRFFALLCFVVVIHWLIFPYPSGLLHWHCGNLTIAPVPAKQPWWIWINTSCEFIMNDCITTTKQSTTKPCAYFLGYTVIYTQRRSQTIHKTDMNRQQDRIKTDHSKATGTFLWIIQCDAVVTRLIFFLFLTILYGRDMGCLLWVQTLVCVQL